MKPKCQQGSEYSIPRQPQTENPGERACDPQHVLIALSLPVCPTLGDGGDSRLDGSCCCLPAPEASGDSADLSTTGTPPSAGNPNLEPLALFIWNIATEQRKRQLCDYFSMCDGTSNSLNMYNMQLPQIRKRDKCFESSFQKKKCLIRIVQGFQDYKKYLQFVRQRIVGDNLQVDAMLSSSKILVDLLPLESKIRERIAQQDNSKEGTFNLDESTKTDWDKQVTVHVILRNFALFMESTIRAIRFMQSAPATAL